MGGQAGRDDGALAGRWALVTGASQGLGRGCALALADEGANVALMARNREKLEVLAGEIRDRGVEARVLVRDVSEIDAAAADIADLPHLDVLVNNAGTNAPQSFLDVDPETFDRVANLNLRAAFFVAQAAARRMVEQGRGSIVNMSSQAGHVGLKLRTVYCATKFAVEGMSKAMAVDLAGTGVRVNCVAPTFVRTEMTAAQLEQPEFRDYVDRNILLGRLAEVSEVAAAVVFLASDRAAMVTGTSLPVDGGWLAH
ncbi:SDR family NAD(P)-dependent oxidoreductase [Rhodovibrio salinarum]|uniref:SDR family oxidoreductase n=1 Tax=Rhodovibrio salinarum TaxID=1087 RepID=A0A934QGI9_9PROT|nr:SDR family NAD(P)-dependent oxidoreductase [Rhodovibrio salinarum]MBK1696140.1 SDR family oxidoreductase [Rhodovibrio salinarum]